MNTETGELRNLSEEEYRNLTSSNIWKQVPPLLQPEAEKELDGKESTIVDLKSNTPLAKWAKKIRDKHNKKQKTV